MPMEDPAMFRTRLLTRLLVPALGAIALQSIAAEDRVSTAPANPPAARTTTASLAQRAKPIMRAALSPIRIGIRSTLEEGNLVILLDDAPIFNGKFEKSILLVSQITIWDPIQVAAGAHRLVATVYGPEKTYSSATYHLELPRRKGAALRFVMKGDKLNVTMA